VIGQRGLAAERQDLGPRVESVSIPDGAHLAVYGLRPDGALS
jgi:hypothetical protein